VICIPFSITENDNVARVSQPIKISIPLGIGVFLCDTSLLIQHENGDLIQCQISPLSYWHDQSVKWISIDFIISIKSNETLQLSLIENPSDNISLLNQSATTLGFFKSDNKLQVNTGIDSFFIERLKGERFSILNPCLERAQSKNLSIQLIDLEEVKYNAIVDSVDYDEPSGSSCTKNLNVKGYFADVNKAKNKLKFELVLTFFLNATYIKIDFTIHNPQAAQHPGGLWDLGDSSSILFQSLALNLLVDESAHVNIYDCASNKDIKCDENAALQQFSSGGVNWNSPVHKNSNGLVDIKKNGFVINSTNLEHHGMRISPIFSIVGQQDTTSVYIEHFWQNFPKAISKQNELLNIELFPHNHFELQGGEKKSHSIWIDFKSQNQKFNWVDKPLQVIIDPKYIESTGALGHFNSGLEQDDISAIIKKSITGTNNFFEKREAVDEYGWRNFGDLYADHETEGYKGNEIFVSHYNNQYDPIFGFIYQYFLTGEPKYFELANDLAKHVIDIDIYHTTDDKDEYNGGLFWHTDHYLDASTCTHRTFSKTHQAAYEGYSSGGGPGGQHCYTTGLKMYYLLTGSEASKKAVLQLADWITFSFEGSNSFLAKLFAIKQSGNHGVKNHILEQYPMDRGTGHYIVALLDAYDLTQKKAYLNRAFKIINNTIHPNDDINSRDFDNIEATWFYTVFLQSVGRFLLVKEQNFELDDDFYYARDAMLHYADWMLKNELPYLEQADKLEFPNATWAGQELRKVGVFYMANYYSPTKKIQFLEKASYFYEHIATTLQYDKNNNYTRILALLMQNIGFASFYQHNVSRNKFQNIRKYTKPVKKNKAIKICSILLKELSRLSLKRELKWLSLRSSKIAKLVGDKG
jgi:hypothetical protein